MYARPINGDRNIPSQFCCSAIVLDPKKLSIAPPTWHRARRRAEKI